MGLAEDFFSALQTYNDLVLPVTILTYILGLSAVYLVSRRTHEASRFVPLILGSLWLWSGVVFNGIFFGPSEVEVSGITMTGMWYFAGVLFVIQGILFIMFGAIQKTLLFGLDVSSYSVVGGVLVVYALAVYPLVGSMTGYAYPRYPVFGSAPCPVVIFTWGLLLWITQRVPLSVAVIPFIWGILGIVPVLVMGIYADVGLILSGVIGLPLILLRNRSSRSGR
jgi:hypothetical protein